MNLRTKLIFNSRRTPEKLNTVLKDWSKQSNNLNFMDYQNSVSLSNYVGFPILS